MRNSYRKLAAAAMAVAALLAVTIIGITACERRPLEVYEKGIARVFVEVDWLSEFQQTPSGMTMLIYDEDGKLVKNLITNNVNREQVYLYPGTYYMTIFSYTQDEYSSMRFRNLSTFAGAITAATELRNHQLQEWEKDAQYMYDPEDIGVAVDTFTISEDMVKNDYKFIDYRLRDQLHPDTTEMTLREIADPMTVKLYITAKIKHRHSVKGVAASISGMADGFQLSQVYRATTPGTLYLTDWQMYKCGDDADSLGVITTEIATFGLPHGKELLAERDSTDNILTFHLILTDDMVQDASFRVGKEIKYIYSTSGREARIRSREDMRDLKIELDLRDTIVAPIKPPTSAGAAFDVWVDDFEYGGAFDFGM